MALIFREDLRQVGLLSVIPQLVPRGEPMQTTPQMKQRPTFN